MKNKYFIGMTTKYTFGDKEHQTFEKLGIDLRTMYPTLVFGNSSADSMIEYFNSEKEAIVYWERNKKYLYQAISKTHIDLDSIRVYKIEYKEISKLEE